MMFLSWRKAQRIGSLAPGKDAIVEGSAAASKGDIAAPGSGTRCVILESLGESFEIGPRGRGRRMWVPKSLDKRSAGFFVDDGTGKVWIPSDTEGVELIKGRQEVAVAGKKGYQRYLTSMICAGDTVRVAGSVDQPKKSEPADCLVIRPDKKGRVRVILRQQAKAD